MLITKEGIQVKNASYKDAIELLTGIRPIAVTENKGEISSITKSWNEYTIQITNKGTYANKLSQGDENAETLKDKLRDEHRPIPEEREDINLFETMAKKLRPNWDISKDSIGDWKHNK